MSGPTAHARAFAEYLAGLVPDERDPTRRGGRAALATFRRALGKGPDEDAGPYRFVGRWLPRDAPWQDQWYYLVAGLFALHQETWIEAEERPASRRRNLGASLRWLVSQSESGGEGVEKRFVALLNAHSDDLPHHLRQVVGLLKAKDVPIDWAWLLDDLLNWERRGGEVRRQWARAFWGDQDQPADNASNGSDNGVDAGVSTNPSPN